MPIHDQGYRRYRGSKAALGQGWIVIARAGIRAMFAKRVLFGLLLAGWGPFFLGSIQIFAAINLPQAQILAVTANTYHDMVDSFWVDLIVFLLAVYVGAGLIAN